MPTSITAGAEAIFLKMNLNFMNIAVFLLFILGALYKAEAQTDIACPSYCFCTKAQADIVCDLTLFNGKCKTVECDNGDPSRGCSKNGYTCKPDPFAPVNLPKTVIKEIREVIRKSGGCKGNVCFAIDGSGSINTTEWSNEKSFINDVMSVLSDFEVRAAATQYAASNFPIQQLTEDFTMFNSALQATNQKRGSTNIQTGMEYCKNQLSTRIFESRVVVVLGDGFENQNDDSADEATLIRATQGTVITVASGPPNSINQKLLDALTGTDRALQFNVGQGFEFGAQKAAELIKDVSIAICNSK